MPNAAGPDALAPLLVDLFEEGLGEERLRLLEAILADPEQRRRYRRYVHTHALLEATLLATASPALGTLGAVPGAAPSVGRPARARSRWRLSTRPLAAAAILAVAIGCTAWALLSQTARPPQDCATVLDAEGAARAVWAPGRRLLVGPMNVPEGSLHFLADDGAEVMVRGPARLALVSGRAVAIAQGTLTAAVPARAVGFAVSTPTARVVDLGTVFSVAVGADGVSVVQVRRGRVSLATDAAAEPALLQAGESRRVSGDGRIATQAYDDRVFAGLPADDPASRWRRQAQALRQDPALVAWFEGPVDEAQGRRLPDLALAHPTGGGAVEGAQLAPGRFPGSSALRFTAPGDRVRVDVPGAFNALTLLAWVRCDGPRGPGPTALLATDGWGVPPLLHWMCAGDGRMTLSLCGPSRRIWNWQAEQPLPPASTEWHLLACAVDHGGTARFSCDRSVLGTSSRPQELVAVIGRALIGNWAEYAHDRPQPPSGRQLRGALDGLVIFSRALGMAEVGAIVDVGRP